MANQWMNLPTKLHALLIRACAEQNITPSQMVESALRRHIRAELPMAKMIIKSAKKLGIKEGSE